MTRPIVPNTTFPNYRSDMNAGFSSLFDRDLSMPEDDTAVSFVSGSIFAVSGDKTDIYLEGRALYLNQRWPALVYVLSVELDSDRDTIVTIFGGTVDSGLSSVKFGIPPLALPSSSVINNRLLTSTTKLFTVGTGGDYSNLRDAIYDVYNKYRVAARFGGVSVTINLLSGYVFKHTISLHNIDCGWITINSTDAEVTIVRSALTAVEGTNKAAFYGNNAVMPVVNVLFNTDKSGPSLHTFGYYLNNGSIGIINSGKGFKGSNLYGVNLYYGSRLNASGGIFSGAVYDGIRAWHNSIIVVENCNITGCGRYGIISVSSCVHADGADVSTCGTYGIYADNSSNIAFTNGIANNISAANAVGIYAKGASTINASGASATGCYRAVVAEYGSTINCDGGTFTGAINHGILAYSGSRICARAANASGAGVNGIYSSTGCFIDAYGANARKGASDSTSDFVVLAGSLLNAVTGTGGVSQTANTITANGIIFK